MTVSYLAVAVVTALLLELLIGIIIVIVIRSPLIDDVVLFVAKRNAQIYALEETIQAGGVALDPHSTFQAGQPSSLTLPEDTPVEGIPYINTPLPTHQSEAFALLITPKGQVLASSYPERYPASTSVSHILSPGQTQLILSALAGRTGSIVEITAQGHVASVAQPILSKQKKPIGAIYVQMMQIPIPGNISFFSATPALLITALLWLIIMAPLGALLGVITTRGMIQRLHRLVTATAQFAHGDYAQRVPTSKKDEIGQLERQFNSMAEQLVASIAQQQKLTDQHARLEERARIEQERVRIEQELRTARYIQKALLPKDVPTLPGWQLAPCYRPAREVGGDFYDFLPLEDGRLGLVIGDATGKGVPAALVMTTTCTMLRAASQGTRSPGKVLAQVNELLVATIPSGMFVTCFYAVLDPTNGSLCYANAGQDWPYRLHSGGVSALQATGMPLGMMPGTCYEEQEAALEVGESLLFYSDGLVEAHNANHEMFGLPRLEALIGEHPGGSVLIDVVLRELAAFTGTNWEQEDDVTLLTLQRAESNGVSATATRPTAQIDQMNKNDDWQTLDEWTVPSQPGNERKVMEQVAEVIKVLHLPTKRLEQIKTAVAEATMNAMEHGNHYQADVPVAIQVLASKTALAIRIRDQGNSKLIPDASEPDLEAKLAERQTARGWGLFLIKNMVDDLNVFSDETHHTIELIVYLEGES